MIMARFPPVALRFTGGNNPAPLRGFLTTRLRSWLWSLGPIRKKRRQVGPVHNAIEIEVRD
jgi:hypothetical protein